MRTVRFHDFGGADVLRINSIEKPNLDRDELLVEVRAAGIDPVIDQTRPTATFTDITTVRGKDLHYHFTSLFDAPDFRSILERLARLFADGTIEIEVDRRYDLEGVPEGHRAVVEDSFCGKRVVVPEVDETS